MSNRNDLTFNHIDICEMFNCKGSQISSLMTKGIIPFPLNNSLSDQTRSLRWSQFEVNNKLKIPHDYISKNDIESLVNKLVDCRIIEMCDPEHLSRINKIVDDKITALLINSNQTILYSDGKTPGENK